MRSVTVGGDVEHTADVSGWIDNMHSGEPGLKVCTSILSSLVVQWEVRWDR